MTLDPQCQAVLDAAAAGSSVFDTDDPAEMRRRYAAGTGIFAPPTPDLASVEDRDIEGPGGALPVRVYTPKAEGKRPVLVFFHGGGWIFGDLDTHDAMCRIVADGAGAVVVAVDYRLAPEHKFPAGLEDCLAATRWVAENAAGIGGDGARIAVGGDSAGGNLAAVVAQQLRDGGPKLAFQWLVYPATDFSADNASIAANGEGYLLTKVALDRTRDMYLGAPEDLRDPQASPILGRDLAGLPPALVQTAGYDPLRDEGKEYADKMKAAGIAVEYICYDGMIHGFARMGALIDCAGTALDDGARALRGAFNQGN